MNWMFFLGFFLYVVFGYHKWESVSAVLLGLGILNVKHLIMLRKVKFYWHLLYDCDAFLCNVFLMFYYIILVRTVLLNQSFSLDILQ